jgi:GntR family transcriptional regulator
MKDLLPTGETHRKIVARRIIRASGKAAEKLEVPAGTRLLEIEAVMHIKETALGYITLNLPYDTGRRVPPNRLKEGPLILLLADICNIQVARVDQWTTAELADTALSDALDIAVGSPILVIERVLYDPSNRPIQWALNRFPPERFGHYIRFQQPVSEVARRRRLINVPARSAL